MRDPLIFSNLSDAKTGHQYVVLFFELSYDERTLVAHKINPISVSYFYGFTKNPARSHQSILPKVFRRPVQFHYVQYYIM